MKISDIILKSTQHDVENASLELILKKTRENKYSTHYSNRHKKILLTAAVTVICAATISTSNAFRNPDIITDADIVAAHITVTAAVNSIFLCLLE